MKRKGKWLISITIRKLLCAQCIHKWFDIYFTHRHVRISTVEHYHVGSPTIFSPPSALCATTSSPHNSSPPPYQRRTTHIDRSARVAMLLVGQARSSRDEPLARSLPPMSQMSTMFCSVGGSRQRSNQAGQAPPSAAACTHRHRHRRGPSSP
jgi:hypothetical protein